jgi:hypothetical protein
MHMGNLPLWIWGVALAIGLPLTLEVGYRLFGILNRSRAAAAQAATGEGWGYLASASMTLLSLLLGFSVSMAADRYEARRQLVVEEANDISTTYLRAQLFAEPAASELRAQLARYARDRHAVFLAREDPARIEAAQVLAEADQDQLWATTAKAIHQPGSEPLTAQFLVAMNAMIDVAATRHAAIGARLPPRIILVLVLNSIAGALLAGYTLGHSGKRYAVMSTVVSLMVAVTLYLILDLDNPRAGGIQVPEAPLDRVINSISQAERSKGAPSPQATPTTVPTR